MKYIMNENLDLTEILKDCPKGTEFYCSHLGENIYFEKIESGLIYCNQSLKYNNAISFYNNGALYACGECMIFPSKEQRDWSKWQRLFIDGDILTLPSGGIFIYRGMSDFCTCRSYCGINCHGDFESYASDNWCRFDTSKRFATEEEKRKLFRAIKDNDYKWNPETKTLEKLSKFEDGDILSYQNSNYLNRTIYIYKHHPKMNTSYYVALSGSSNSDFMVNIEYGNALDSYNDTVRFATEEEKQRLFDAIKANGYKWNSETKTLEKLIVPKFKVGDKIRHKNHPREGYTVTEIKDTHYILDDELALPFLSHDGYELVPNKFDPKFLNPFDKVLVRDNSDDAWSISLYSHYSGCMPYPFECINLVYFRQCIPYEGNEHLLNTVNDCDEYYKN